MTSPLDPSISDGTGEARPSPRRELRARGRRAKKSLGQHFLNDSGVVQKIITAADLSRSDTVVEVGPGLGVLTDALARAAGRVVAVEIDTGLAEDLRVKLARRTNLTVVTGDIMKLSPRELLAQPGAEPPPSYKLVANLPYYITSAVLRRLLEASPRPSLLVVMVQREVAKTMTAVPGNLTVLGISIQLHGRPRIVTTVPPGSFYPPPKVESAVVRIDVAPTPVVDIPDEITFFRVVRAGFATRRKQLHNSLTQRLGLPGAVVRGLLDEAGVDPTRRPQTLNLEEWAALARGYAALGLSAPPAPELDEDDEDDV